MLKVAAVFALAVLAVFAFTTPSPAISIDSGAGFTTCTSGLQACVAPANVNNPLPWGQGNSPLGSTAVWVSYAATTNVDGGGPLNSPDITPVNATVHFFQDLGSTGGQLSLSIWADDTAGVNIDGGAYLVGPDPGPYPHCANGAGSVGCDVGEQGVLNIFLNPGSHFVQFDVFQRGGDFTPFGLLYTGSLTPVPEPATILLLGSALTAAGVVSRRRWRKPVQVA